MGREIYDIINDMAEVLNASQISVTHHIISDIITFSITNLHDEMEKSYFLPPTNSYISALMPPILPIMHQMMPQFCPPSVCNPYSLHKFH